MADMRVLTVKQPWAWAIIHGGKDVENRSWTTQYRGPLAIRAGKAWVASAAGDINKRTGAGVPMVRAFGDPKYPLGAIIGIVDLVDVVTESESPWTDGSEYHWVLANPRPLPEPSFIGGGLGLRWVHSALADFYLAEISGNRTSA